MGESEPNPMVEWIKDYSFCKDATFIDPKEESDYCDLVDFESNETKKDKIEVNAIVYFDGLYLVEEIGDEGDWQMGQVDSSEMGMLYLLG